MAANKVILSLDIGKYDTKAMGRKLGDKVELKTTSIRTKFYDLKNGYLDVEGDNSYSVAFEDKYVIVGEQGNEISYETSKTNDIHRICGYVAITQFIEPDTKDNEIYLVLACPISVLKNTATKDKYKNFIKGEGPIEITVDNKHYTFTIKEIAIKGEGSGIVYTDTDMFKNNSVAVIDLGGLNFTFSLYNNCSCNNDNRFITEDGAFTLYRMVQDELILYKNGNLVRQDTAILATDRGYLTKGTGKPDTDSMQYIGRAKEKYLKSILDIIKSRKFALDEVDKVVFVGGTVNKLLPEIKELDYNVFIPNEPEYATVKGLYKLAYALYGKNK